jgi:hypothetical protein
MSLAMTAQSIENSDYNNNDNRNCINDRKRQTNNKTQKRMPASFNDIDHSKVQNVLNSIHKNLSDDIDNNLGDYNPRNNSSTPVNSSYTPINPLAPPASMRQRQEPEQKEGNKEGMSNYDYNTEDVDNYSNKFVPQPVQNDNMDLQDLQGVYMNNEQVKRYYKNLVPNFATMNKTNSTEINLANFDSRMNTNLDTNNVLIDKLNYMINLLEEQQDERTNNVTEEVILYSFLGVFIIFVVDGFARVTRYTR